jgi:2-dehydropantoate 2-reductase
MQEVFEQFDIDLVVIAVKTFDTIAVARDMQPWRDHFKAVLSLQNGVENEDALREWLGSDRIIAGTLTSAISKKGVGQVVLEKKRGVGLAEDHPLAGQIEESLRRAGLNARLYPDGSAMKWSKLLTNLLVNASSAILDYTPAQILADPKLFELEALQIREALRMMEAQRLRVVDLPGTPVRMLALLMRSLPLRLSQVVARKSLAAGRGGKMPSFHIDLHQGRGKIEVDALNGAVVRFGRQLGIGAPVNQFLNHTLLRLANGDLSIDTYRHNPQKLLADLSTTRSQ